MRGGALFQLAWGALLAAFLVGCWVWTGDALQTAEFGFAVVVTWTGATAVILRGRGEALRRGEPPPASAPLTVPTSSLGAVLVAIAAASILFGFTFGAFLIFFGAGLMIAGLGLLGVERRTERRALRAVTRSEQAPR